MIFLSYFSLYLLLFDLDIPFFRGVGSSPFSLMISLAVIYWHWEEVKKRIPLLREEFTKIALLFIGLSLYVAIRIFIDGMADLSYLGTSLKGLTIFVATICYLLAFEQQDLFEKLLNIFFINALIALFVGTIQDFQPYVNLFKPNGSTELIGRIAYRNAFLSGSGYFGIGAPFGIASAFFIGILLQAKKLSLSALFKLVVIVLMAIFAARTVFFCLAIVVGYLIFIRRNLQALFIFIVLALLGYGILSLEMFQHYQTWIFELFAKGIAGSESGAHFFAEHLKLPKDIYTFFFGAGKYVSATGGYYMNTDVGYLRHWYFGGIFFMLATLLIPILLYVKNKQPLFLWVIIPCCLVLHLKGLLIYNNPTATPLLILISHILYTRYKENSI
ncbi:Uncharacterised protein [Canicola haemoglobinophilus]|uniref:Uncharacterized protein n=1 Tax=Canicola haemoglobinophilus TaxID=733 RepID=A0A377HVQ8_9PAST|nr:hypothetical protein [Canicola haemoglobinophilus]STO54142.1 Uncharacterised protein [Canicola haemoglobinophilus]STO60423.1 Uncharacterised protein [Canicola haemoglobinophilus]STO68675.1 Uncharacterised protein [Canicola haemoglobinophilus]